ncbi:MAG: MOSC domain-containing protein [Anaerolineales bacterium]|jgi:MOSC domain-containing protein YiiM
MTSVTSIVYKPKGTAPDQEDHYLRTPLDSANLVAGYGIEGDRKGGNPKRNLNIMSYETLEALREEGFSTLPGQMGEQIDIKGLDMGNLAVGDKLQIGDAAIVEVISQRTGCERFEHIQGKTPQQAAGRMGIMAKVVSGGRIAVGDSVTLL